MEITRRSFLATAPVAAAGCALAGAPVALAVFRSIETALVTKPFFTRHHEKFSLIITVCQ